MKTIQILAKNLQVVLPILAYHEPFSTDCSVEVVDELLQEILRVVLDGVEAHSGQVQFVTDPFAPPTDVGADFGLFEINIREHSNSL